MVNTFGPYGGPPRQAGGHTPTRGEGGGEEDPGTSGTSAPHTGHPHKASKQVHIIPLILKFNFKTIQSINSITFHSILFKEFPLFLEISFQIVTNGKIAGSINK